MSNADLIGRIASALIKSELYERVSLHNRSEILIRR